MRFDVTTLYALLYRLENPGLVEGKWVEKVGQRRRRYYNVTAWADVVGRQLQMNGTPLTVVGVAPKGFLGVSAIFGPDAWLPVTMFPQIFPCGYGQLFTDQGKSLFHAVVRLKEGKRKANYKRLCKRPLLLFKRPPCWFLLQWPL